MNLILRPFRKLKHETGQAAVEFAGVMIPFTLLFLIIVDGGMLFVQWINNTNAVREGARCAVVGGDLDAVRAKVGQPTGATGPADVVWGPDGDDNGTTVDSGDPVTVRMTWEYDWITPVGLFGGSNLTRTSESTMRLEADDFDKPTCTGGGSG
jgi:Flp pilus assembly protein TadG